MKLISWNVNGLRSCLTKGFLDFFREIDADAVCLQETKMQEGQAVIDTPGYYQYYNSAVKKGYSGTAIYTRIKPLSVAFGIGDKHNDEGRAITLEFEELYLVNVYSPNAQPELARLGYRMEFEDDLRAYLTELAKTKPVVLCGDLNVAHNEIDLKNPKTNVGNPGFSNEEREKFTELLGSGFLDSFRTLYPEQKDAYSWWSYRAGARGRNIGWRIDYFVISDSLKDKVIDSKIYPEVHGSDHCPVGLELAL